jgi:myosin-crossreactive antigen
LDSTLLLRRNPTSTGLAIIANIEKLITKQQMNGKILVGGIVIFFILFFVYESWLMRGLPH